MFNLPIFIILLYSFGLGTGCGVDENESSVKYLLIQGGDENHAPLARYVFAPELEICLAGDMSNKDILESRIKQAVDIWLQPLREYYANIATSSRISCSAPHVTIIASKRTERAYTNPRDGVMRINSNSSLQTLAHEMGHFFGLADTYHPSADGTCLMGHPDSMMCSPQGKSQLSADDLAAVQHMVRKLNPIEQVVNACEAKEYTVAITRLKLVYQLPLSPPGTTLNLRAGSKHIYRFPRCHRIWWSDMDFVCKKGQWIRTGKSGSGPRCHTRNDLQKNLKFFH